MLVNYFYYESKFKILFFCGGGGEGSTTVNFPFVR